MSTTKKPLGFARRRSVRGRGAWDMAPFGGLVFAPVMPGAAALPGGLRLCLKSGAITREAQP